jgi:hypothetical protein
LANAADIFEQPHRPVLDGNYPALQHVADDDVIPFIDDDE